MDRVGSDAWGESEAKVPISHIGYLYVEQAKGMTPLGRSGVSYSAPCAA